MNPVNTDLEALEEYCKKLLEIPVPELSTVVGKTWLKDIRSEISKHIVYKQTLETTEAQRQ